MAVGHQFPKSSPRSPRSLTWFWSIEHFPFDVDFMHHSVAGDEV